MKLMDAIKNRKTYWLFALLCAALWGSATPCVKIAYTAFRMNAADTGAQLLMMGLRFMLAGVLTELLGRAVSGRLMYPATGSARAHVALLSLTQILLLYGLYSIGVAHASGTAAAMINGTSTFFTILFATLVFRTEKGSGRKALACLLGFGAIVLMHFKGGGFTFTAAGEGALLLSQCLAGLSHNFTKRFSAEDDPAMLTAWQNFFGGLVLAVCGYALGGRLVFTFRGTVLLFYLAFVSGAAFSLWGLLMKYHEVSKINIFMLANPLFGVLFSALFLGEGAQAFRWRTFGALLLISGGILLLNLGADRGSKEKTGSAKGQRA